MPKSSLFDVPAPIKQLFDSFPLHTYHPNDLPHRAPKQRNAHVLYTFTTPHDAARGAPSYNPTCLKWQVNHPLSPSPAHSAHCSPTGLPRLPPHSHSNRTLEQPRLAQRLAPLPPARHARAIQAASPARAVAQAAKMGAIPQRKAHRRAQRPALRSLSLATRPPRASSLGA